MMNRNAMFQSFSLESRLYYLKMKYIGLEFGIQLMGIVVLCL